MIKGKRMLNKNQTIELTCTGVGAAFEGVCRHEGQVVFVPGALPGETVTAKIIKVSKQYAVGKLLDIANKANQRITPPCQSYPRCGGCTAQHIAYEDTLLYKQKQVADCLDRIGGVTSAAVLPVLGMETPWRYRNKGAFPVGGAVGAPRIGCFAARSHDIVDAAGGCLLQVKESDALVSAVKRWMLLCGIEPYQEASHQGLLRHIMTRKAADGSVMLVLVINGKTLKQPDVLITYAREACPALRSVIVCKNTKRTNVILGDAMQTLWGEDCLHDEIAGFRMRVSPRSFFQVNREQAERLYETALSFAALTGTETVWDVYCGCGSITLPLSKKAKRVIGIEVVEDAVADARINAKENGVSNVTFIQGAAEQALPSLAKKQGAPDVIVVDPPRKGCEPEVIAAIAETAPARLIYVSCNPATLARDIALLAEKGYALQKVQPVDMFPWTSHVETVVLLSRVEK